MFLKKILHVKLLFNIARTSLIKESNILRHISTNVSVLQSPAKLVDFKNEAFQKYLASLRKEFYDLRCNAVGDGNAYARLAQLNDIVSAYEKYRVLENNLVSKEDLQNEDDEEMRQLMEEENKVYGDLLSNTEEEIIKEMLNLTDGVGYPSVIFEINAGAGGQEAMLFTKDLYEMYINFFESQNWAYEILDMDETDIGGLRHVNLIVHSQQAYAELQCEAGVHRVQRVPETEKSGRIHTSTASVAVIPRFADVHIEIAEKDLKIETKRASGAGGQHVNTTDSAVRVVHLPTGIAVECQAERSQIKNRETAIRKLQSKLLQRQLEKVEEETQITRKSQQGTLNRNEKIRTYNFVQDRVTDHRLQGGTVHNLKEFLNGGDVFRTFIQRLVMERRMSKLIKILGNEIEPETIHNKIEYKTTPRK